MAPRHASSNARPSATAIRLDALSAAHAGAADIAARQAERLASLLQAARDGTRFYRETLRGRNLSGTALATLPVNGKRQLMQRFADLVSDPMVTLEGLRAFCADSQRIGEPFLGRYFAWESSGSTGEPGLFVQDATAMAVYDALEAARRHSPRPMARLLDPLYLGERFAFVGVTGGHYASHVSVRRLRSINPWLASRSRSMSVLQPAQDLVAELNDFAPTLLATYPTAALMLAEEAARGTLRLRPQEIWTGGETLAPAMRSRIEHVFGCPVRDSYGASEFLPIAFECGQARLHVNADWVILEPVDDRHQPMPAGLPSRTTLLTNLANHVQPLIRFDIGDSTVFDVDACPCGCPLPTLRVQGRRDDALVMPGRQGRPVTLLPLALICVLEEQAGVFDFELRQQDARRWCLTLGPGTGQAPGLRRHCREVLAGFARRQGAVEPRITTRVSAALPLGASGKLKRIVAGRAGAAPKPRSPQ